jgi:hypothetical protein
LHLDFSNKRVGLNSSKCVKWLATIPTLFPLICSATIHAKQNAFAYFYANDVWFCMQSKPCFYAKESARTKIRHLNQRYQHADLW